MRSNAKTQAVKEALKTNPSLSNREIAELVGCHVTYVHQLRKKLMTKAKIAHAKVKVAKAKKIGRPNIFETLEKACATLLKFVGERKDMCIAFDHAKDKVEIVWGEEIYNARTDEVIDLLMAIKKLDTHRQTFS